MISKQASCLLHSRWSQLISPDIPHTVQEEGKGSPHTMQEEGKGSLRVELTRRIASIHDMYRIFSMRYSSFTEITVLS